MTTHHRPLPTALDSLQPFAPLCGRQQHLWEGRLASAAAVAIFQSKKLGPNRRSHVQGTSLSVIAVFDWCERMRRSNLSPARRIELPLGSPATSLGGWRLYWGSCFSYAGTTSCRAEPFLLGVAGTDIRLLVA